MPELDLYERLVPFDNAPIAVLENSQVDRILLDFGSMDPNDIPKRANGMNKEEFVSYAYQQLDRLGGLASEAAVQSYMSGGEFNQTAQEIHTQVQSGRAFFEGAVNVLTKYKEPRHIEFLGHQFEYEGQPLGNVSPNYTLDPLLISYSHMNVYAGLHQLEESGREKALHVLWEERERAIEILVDGERIKSLAQENDITATQVRTEIQNTVTFLGTILKEFVS